MSIEHSDSQFQIEYRGGEGERMEKCFNEAIVTHTQGMEIAAMRVCYQIKFVTVIQPKFPQTLNLRKKNPSIYTSKTISICNIFFIRIVV
jgi:hypothetical protein